MDPLEYQAQKRRMSRESTQRAKTATRGARESTGVGGFVSGAPKMAPPRPTTAPWKPQAPSSATELGGAVDTGGPPKSYGIGEGDQGSSLDYMGHFANDEVIRRGHNVGMQPKGKATSMGIAQKGYRRLPGTGANQIGHNRFGSAYDELPPPRHAREQEKVQMAGPMPPSTEPKLVRDVKLSAQHHKDSMAFHQKHMRDHAIEIKTHKQALRGRSKQLKST